MGADRVAPAGKMRNRAKGSGRDDSDHKVVVAYSVKELLTNLEDKLDQVLDQMDTKAASAELGKLAAKVDELDRACPKNAELGDVESRVRKIEEGTARKEEAEELASRVAKLENSREVQNAVEENSAAINKTNKRWRWVLASAIVGWALSIATMVVEFLRK